MLISLQGDMQHFPSLITFLVDKLGTYLQQSREAGLNDLVELDPAIVLGSLESEGAACDEETLQSSQDGRGIVGM